MGGGAGGELVRSRRGRGRVVGARCGRVPVRVVRSWVGGWGWGRGACGAGVVGASVRRGGGGRVLGGGRPAFFLVALSVHDETPAP